MSVGHQCGSSREFLGAVRARDLPASVCAGALNAGFIPVKTAEPSAELTVSSAH